MKQLFILPIFIILFFVGCSDSDSNINSYNPVKGEWNVYDDEGALLHRRVYTSEQYAYFSILDGIALTNVSFKYYRVKGNRLIFREYTQTFRIEQDTLWITNSGGDQTTKYIRQKDIIE